jgi:hypothetical protein
LQYLLKQAIHHVYGRQLEILGLSLASKLAIQPRTTNELWPILLLLHVNLVTYRSVAVEREHFSQQLLQQAIHVYGRLLEILGLSLAWTLTFHPESNNRLVSKMGPFTKNQWKQS